MDQLQRLRGNLRRDRWPGRWEVPPAVAPRLCSSTPSRSRWLGATSWPAPHGRLLLRHHQRHHAGYVCAAA
jgi:hypothetical protein